MSKVSIVVPCYDVEDHIGPCLESLMAQTHPDIEILCVDDCSTDRSVVVIEAKANEDQRITILRHSENKGRGGARNTGIRNATGDYICFVDADDYVSSSFVEILVGVIGENNADVAICNMMSVDGEEVTAYETNFLDTTYVVDKSRENVLEVAMQFNPACTNKMFRRSLLAENDVFQPEHCYYEDVTFWLEAVLHCRRIASISDRLYYYRWRYGSVMNTLELKHIDDRFSFIDKIDELVKRNILSIPGSNDRKVKEDLLIYIMRHLDYGVQLIERSQVTDKVSFRKYFEDRLESFSTEKSWGGLPVALKLYQFNKEGICRNGGDSGAQKGGENSVSESMESRGAAYTCHWKKPRVLWVSVLLNILLMVFLVVMLLA